MYFNLLIPYSIINLSLKKVALSGESPRIDHYREYPPEQTMIARYYEVQF